MHPHNWTDVIPGGDHAPIASGAKVMRARTTTAAAIVARSWRVAGARPSSLAVRPARARPTGGLKLRSAVAGSVLLGAVVFAMTTDGGRHIRAAQPVGQDLDAIAESAGLGLFQISVTGQRRTPDSDLFDAAQGGQSHSLLLFDTAAARARIEALPWIAVARVKRAFPDELRIDVTEREPFARWRQDGRDMLFDATGRLLGPAPADAFPDLPVVTGAGATDEAVALLQELRRWPVIARRIDYAERVGGRRWRLALRDGRRIELPPEGWQSALATAATPRSGVALADRAFAVLDLRLPGQPMVRPLEPRPAALAVRP